MKHTIHEPTTIRGYISFGDSEVEISEDLHNFKKNPIFICTIHLRNKRICVRKPKTYRLLNKYNHKIKG